MTATAPIPAAEAPPMANTPDNRPDQPTAKAAPAPAAAPAGTEAKPRRWAILGDNPLLTVMGTLLGTLLAAVATAAVGLLFFVLNDHGDRIDALDAKMEQRFAEQDAKFDDLGAEMSELDRKLTVLIAVLNKTDEVNATIEGRLLGSEPAAAPAPAPG